MGTWLEKSPGLTRARVRAGGDHWLDDAQGPGPGDGEFPALPCPYLSPRTVRLGSGHLPWAPGRERAVPEAGGRQAWCGPCPSGECLVAGWN